MTQWTETAPTEPGWYFARGDGLDDEGEPVRFEQNAACESEWYALRAGDDSPYSVDPEGAYTCAGWLWWPIPLQPPPAEPIGAGSSSKMPSGT